MFKIIRSIVLLSVLIFLPVIAVCWNIIPKEISWTKDKTDSISVAQIDPDNPQLDQTTTNIQNNKNNESESVWFDSSIPLSADPLLGNSPSDGSVSDKNAIGETLPNQSSGDPNALRFMPMTPLLPKSSSDSAPVVTSGGNGVIDIGGQRDFSEIVKELQQLGATYYCLEKWGNQGDLFRFRCYINPQNNSAPNSNNQQNNNKYQKFFQHIDNDQIRVMEHVISEIKKWKSSL